MLFGMRDAYNAERSASERCATLREEEDEEEESSFTASSSSNPISSSLSTSGGERGGDWRPYTGDCGMSLRGLEGGWGTSSEEVLGSVGGADIALGLYLIFESEIACHNNPFHFYDGTKRQRGEKLSPPPRAKPIACDRETEKRKARTSTVSANFSARPAGNKRSAAELGQT